MFEKLIKGELNWHEKINNSFENFDYNDLQNKPASLPADGGNADTLDGKHAKDFFDSPVYLDSIDIDTITTGGFQGIAASTCTNLPTKSFYYLQNFVWSGKQIKQIALGYLDEKIFSRRKLENVWLPWSEVWDTSSVSFSAQGIGFIRFPVGISYQWGNIATQGNNIASEVIYPLAFSSIYSVSATSLNLFGHAVSTAYLTNTSFKVYNSDPAPSDVSWVAIGKI